MFANQRWWRINFTQGNKIIIHNPDGQAGAIIEYPLVSDEFHTYTLQYDEKKKMLKIRVDGILLGSCVAEGRETTNTGEWFQLFNTGAMWQSGRNEVYLEHIALYGD